MALVVHVSVIARHPLSQYNARVHQWEKSGGMPPPPSYNVIQIIIFKYYAKLMKTEMVHLLYGYFILIIIIKKFPQHLLGSRGVSFILSVKVRLGAGKFFRNGAKMLHFE